MDAKSIVERAKDQIEQWIISEDLVPGQQIKEEEIAERLNISRPPIREAFKILEADGIVFKKPRRGVFVSIMSARDVWEVYTLKAALYEMSAALAIEVISEEGIMQLEVMVEKMEACIKKKPIDLFHYQFLHRSYHDTIMTIAGNDRLLNFSATLHNQVNRISYKSLKNKKHLNSSVIYHKRIVKAFKKKQSAQACKLMKEHVLKALEVLLNEKTLRPAALDKLKFRTNMPP